MARNARIIFLVVLAAVVVGALQVAPRGGDTQIRAGAVPMPSATSEGVESNAWYCAAALQPGTDPAAAEIIISNAGEKELRAIVQVMPSTTGETRLVNVLRGETRVPLADLVTSDSSSVLVEVFGGDATVSHRVGDSLDGAQTPCASEAATSWWIPYATTEKGSEAELVLMNPFAEDAGVSVEIHTRAGRRFPAGYDNITVPSFSSVTVPLHEPVQREHVFAVQVTAHRGRVVAEQLIKLDGAGIAVFLGFNHLSAGWDFVGDVPEADVTFLSLYNPSDKVAEAAVTVYDVEGQPIYEEDTILRAHAPTVVGISDAVEGGVPYRVAVRGKEDAEVAAAMVGRTGGEVTDIPYSEVGGEDEDHGSESAPPAGEEAPGAPTTTVAEPEPTATTTTQAVGEGADGGPTTTDAAAMTASLFAPGGVSFRLAGVVPYARQAEEPTTTTTAVEEDSGAEEPAPDEPGAEEPAGEDPAAGAGAPDGTSAFETIRPAAAGSKRWLAASIVAEGSPADEVLVGNPGDKAVLVEMRGFAGGVNTDLASRLSVPPKGFAIVPVTSANALVEVRAQAEVTVARRVLGQSTIVSPAVGFR